MAKRKTIEIKPVDFRMDFIEDDINDAVSLCYEQAKESGWWVDINTGEPLNKAPRIVAEKLCLIHSEVSEAMEGYRKNLKDDKLPHRSMLEVELADVLIRVFDLAGALDLDLGGAVKEKLDFNRTRQDHKLENRKSKNGKRF